MTKSADSTHTSYSQSQPKAGNADAESLRLKQEQEQLAEASFQETYSAITSLFKIKQTKYQKTLNLAFLEGKISLQAIVIFAILMLLICVFMTTLWCLVNIAIVLAVMHFFSALWLGLLTAAGMNVLLIALFVMLLKMVKRQVGFSRTKRVLAGDL